jgi:hypothetical protein
MILFLEVTVIIQASEDNYFLLVQRSCHENEFIAGAKVHSNSPAAELVSRIYCCLFNDVIDILAEYKKYYVPEYKTIWDYLYWHYLIKPGVIEKVRKSYNPCICLFYGNVHSGGDYGVGQYVMSEEGVSLVEKILKAVIRGKGK